MSKANFSLRILFCDLENYSGALPFAEIFDEIEIIVHDEPDHSLSRGKFNDLDLAAMDVLIVIIEFATQLVRTPLYIFGPPSADIINGIKGFLWRLVYQNNGCEILVSGADRRNKLPQTIGYNACPCIGYLQRVRIEAAKKMLENKNDGIAQIASRCGYEDVDYFGKIFRRYLSMTPRAYREKYGRNKNR